MSILVWFRRDLRVQDNPALARAVADARELRQPLVAVYVHDPQGTGGRAVGAASRWYLDRSLRSLQDSLSALGIPLHLERGSPILRIGALANRLGGRRVYWNRVLEPEQAALDDALTRALLQAGVPVRTFDDDCLIMPEHLRRADGSPYRVFTPFWRRAYGLLEAGGLHDRLPAKPGAVGEPMPADPTAVDRLGLLDPNAWHRKLGRYWQPGERTALGRWGAFFGDGIQDYDTGRDLPGIPGTSGLSPALHFGELSALRLYAQCAERLAGEADEVARAGIIRFMIELGWREFARHVLHAWPDLPDRSLDRRFDRPDAWEADADGRLLRACQQGETGFSLVDAGMRQLWETGWMHNRVRMVVASFLTKNIGLHWREGARWFWDTLVDADLASNTLGWQWVAGCGTDAAPYYRIFNPETQAQRFDPDYSYRGRWLGEGVRPAPVLDLRSSRERALERYRHAIKNRAA